MSRRVPEPPWKDPAADPATPVLTVRLMPNGTIEFAAAQPVPFPVIRGWLRWVASRYEGRVSRIRS